MKSNVLIVEDEALVALEIRECVEHLGHNVSAVVDTAQDAVQHALSRKPDLIIMDIRLKGTMDGIEAASLIRKSASVPVIFLSAYSGDEFLERAKITEPYGYLLKPIHEEQLESAIRMTIHKHSRDTRRKMSMDGLSAVLSALPGGIVVVDPSLKVKYINRKAEELIGVIAKSAVGNPLSALIHLNDTRLDMDTAEGFDETLGEGISFNFGDHMLLVDDGDAIPVRIDVSPLRNKANVIIGMLLAVTDLRPPSEALAIARKQASDADGAQPFLEQKGDVRSYLEVEIVRLSMNVESGEAPVKYFQEGQIAAYRNVLSLLYGEDASRELDYVLPK